MNTHCVDEKPVNTHCVSSTPIIDTIATAMFSCANHDPEAAADADQGLLYIKENPEDPFHLDSEDEESEDEESEDEESDDDSGLSDMDPALFEYDEDDVASRRSNGQEYDEHFGWFRRGATFPVDPPTGVIFIDDDLIVD